MTEVGLELARTARAVAAEWEGFEQRLDARKGYLRGTLRVAVVSTAKYFVPRLPTSTWWMKYLWPTLW
jgi:LysR family transcriptional regulator, low CO2-responsive transcriptional regulator